MTDVSYRVLVERALNEVLDDEEGLEYKDS